MENPSEWRTGIKPGYRTKVIQHGSGTIYIHRPELNQAEQAKREQDILHALQQFARNTNH